MSIHLSMTRIVQEIFQHPFVKTCSIMDRGYTKKLLNFGDDYTQKWAMTTIFDSSCMTSGTYVGLGIQSKFWATIGTAGGMHSTECLLVNL